MADTKLAPYGEWASPITAEAIVAESVSFAGIRIHGEDVFWLESRPSEAGRHVIVRQGPDGVPRDLLPAPLSARTRVHEYGGGSFLPADGAVWFSNDADSRIWRRPGEGEAEPVTDAAAVRYADFDFDARRGLLYCVREDAREEGCAVGTIVRVDPRAAGVGEVVAGGADFFSTPRVSPDGSRLCWLSWNHPNMPWDGTVLTVADLDEEGRPTATRTVAGGEAESIFQPEWGPDGALWFVSDRTGWWNLYRLEDAGSEAAAVCPREADFGFPQWQFGFSTYVVLGPDRAVCAWQERGFSRLGVLDASHGTLTPVEIPWSSIMEVRAAGDRVILTAASAAEPMSVVDLDLGTGGHRVLRRSTSLAIDPGYAPAPEAIEFPTEGGLTAHAFYYAPASPGFAAPEGERPPLLVFSHGGPTAMTIVLLSPAIRFWTSRGVGVVDVNYGGSTGYGRAYRERLKGKWGIVDVDDCSNAARFLVERGDADPDRLAIRGGSAGGFTTLAALTFRDVFRAGASLFGVSDLSALAKETHKFESRYLDGLVGPYPERKDIYEARSPIHNVDGLDCPVIFLQGLEDKVVPPNQAERMVAALEEKGIPVCYVPFEGEQHGFRRAETIKRALNAELTFYGKVLGFRPADPEEPIDIRNI